MGDSPFKRGGAGLGAASAVPCRGLLTWQCEPHPGLQQYERTRCTSPFLCQSYDLWKVETEETAPCFPVPSLLPTPWVSLESHFGFLLAHPGSRRWGRGLQSSRHPAPPQSLLGCPPQEDSTAHDLPYQVCEQLAPYPRWGVTKQHTSAPSGDGEIPPAEVL